MYFCLLSLHNEGVLGNLSPSHHPVLLIYNFFARVQVRWLMTLGLGTGEMFSDLDGLLGSQYFLNFANERTCFASCACTFESFS